jgi:hypothetical protein
MNEPISASVFLQDILSSPYKRFEVSLLELIETSETQIGQTCGSNQFMGD